MKLRVFLVWLSVSAALAQDAGTIFGTVNDASGAVVTGAKVTLLHVDTNVSQDTLSNADGEFIFTPLRIGNYTLRVDLRSPFWDRLESHEQLRHRSGPGLQQVHRGRLTRRFHTRPRALPALILSGSLCGGV